MFDFDELEAIEATGVRPGLDEQHMLQADCIATDIGLKIHTHVGDAVTTKHVEEDCNVCIDPHNAIDQNAICEEDRHVMQDGELETRVGDEERLAPKCGAEGQVIEQTIQADKKESLIDAGKLHSLARLILWPRMAPKPGSLLKSPCRHVCVFGAYHTCTGAMMREIPRFFDVSIVNRHYNDNPRLWKHTIFRRRPPITDSTFCVCLVKDPAFWIQSLARDPLAGTFYEIFPLGASYNQRKQWEFVPVEPRDKEQLFRRVLFDGLIYQDALAVWEGTVRSYFDETIFFTERTVVVRCEDFLFDFDSVITALAHRGLPLRHDAPAERTPIDATAKDRSHPDVTRRDRHELLKYYREPANRFNKLSAAQKQRLNAIDKGVVAPLGYHAGAVHSWLVPTSTN